MLQNLNDNKNEKWNDYKLQQDKIEVDNFKKCLISSEQQTIKMANLLTNFENRLSCLSDLIMPVYLCTNDLKIKITNVNNTINSLNNVIEYYETTKNLSQIIRAGPGKDINSYLVHLDKLKSAIDYFAINGKINEKIQSEELWNIGKRNVDREYELLLNKHSNEAIIIQNNETDYENQSLYEEVLVDYADDSINFNEDDFKQIVSILSWFKNTESSYTDFLLEKLIRFRRDSVLDTLKKIIQNSNSFANKRQSISIIQTNNSPILVRSGGKMDTLKNKFSDIRKKKIRSTSNITETQKLSILDQDIELIESDRFIKCITKCLNKFLLESKFVTKLLEHINISVENIIGHIFEPILRFIIVEAERITSNVNQISNKRTSKIFLSLFDVLSEMAQLKSYFLKLFEESTNLNSIILFLDIFVCIEKSCVSGLKDILDEVKNDSKAIPLNGNIHSITTETITFIENLLPYDIIAGVIANNSLDIDNSFLPSEAEKKHRENKSKVLYIAYKFTSALELKTSRISIVEYFSKLLRYLNLNLSNKAEGYTDTYMKYVFLLNNYCKISKLFSNNEIESLFSIRTTNLCKNQNVTNKNTLMDLYTLAGKPSFKETYEIDIKKFKQEYFKSWDKIISYIDRNKYEMPIEGKIKEKERHLIKEKFHAFNKEFEDIIVIQSKYFIPSSELAEEIREEIMKLIVYKYKLFYETFSCVNFASNKEKYLKYRPDDIKQKIKELFFEH